MIAWTILWCCIAHWTTAIAIHGTLVTVNCCIHASLSVWFFNGDFVTPSALLEYLKKWSKFQLFYMTSYLLSLIPIGIISYSGRKTCRRTTTILAMIPIWNCVQSMYCTSNVQYTLYTPKNVACSNFNSPVPCTFGQHNSGWLTRFWFHLAIDTGTLFSSTSLNTGNQWCIHHFR